MVEREWKIGHHYFFSASEYQSALQDQKLIKTLETTYDLHNLQDLDKLYNEITNGHIRFTSIIGREFDDKVYEEKVRLQKLEEEKQNSRKTAKVISFQAAQKKIEKKKNKEKTKEKKTIRLEEYEPALQKEIIKELKRRERRRKWLLISSLLIGIGCSAYVIQYMQSAKNSSSQYQDLSALKNKTESIGEFLNSVQVHKTKEQDVEKPNVLTEYKTLQSKNQELIGWIKIAGTDIDYPVMQGKDNAFYLTHNFEKKEDKNGCIFMDTQCDVIRHSTNYILYGHHMQSGNMFGNLYLYEKEDYGKEHHLIQFDTIYEKGTYELMYVFRSRVYSEEDISFKYYQFIDANSSKEFYSYMNEMAKISYYDTGVTAQYGDQLLTLSTCDYEENGGRFVVVCKKVK